MYDFQAAFGDMTRMVREMNTMEQSDHRKSNGVQKEVAGTITIPASPPPLMIVTVAQTPAEGRCWNVRWVGVYANNTTNTGLLTVSIDIMVGMPPFVYPDGSAVADVIFGNAETPGDTELHRDAFWCWPSEYVYGVASGSPGLSVNVGSSIQLVARVTEYPMTDILECIP